MIEKKRGFFGIFHGKAKDVESVPPFSELAEIVICILPLDSTLRTQFKVTP